MNARLTASVSLISCFLLIPLAIAGPSDIKPTKGAVRASDGLNIAYDIRGKGDTALVFLHGWCGDRTAWKHQLDAFAGDYRVVAIDHAGHGESGTERKNWSVLGLADDVQAVVTKLELKRVILVGHSMGGSVSLAAAKRLPDVVIGVIGVDTLHNAEYQMPEEQTKKIVAGFEADFKGMMRIGMLGMLPEKADPELVDWITTKAQSRDPKMAVALFRQLLALDIKMLLKDAKVPVLTSRSAAALSSMNRRERGGQDMAMLF